MHQNGWDQQHYLKHRYSTYMQHWCCITEKQEFNKVQFFFSVGTNKKAKQAITWNFYGSFLPSILRNFSNGNIFDICKPMLSLGRSTGTFPTRKSLAQMSLKKKTRYLCKGRVMCHGIFDLWFIISTNEWLNLKQKRRKPRQWQSKCQHRLNVYTRPGSPYFGSKTILPPPTKMIFPPSQDAPKVTPHAPF
jgi:hypothetical protein